MNLGNSKIINFSRFSGGGNQRQFIIKTGNNKKVFIVLGFVMLLLWRTGFIANGQTVLVDPAGDGGFENGTTFSANGWTEVNDNTNYWVVGTDTKYSGNRSAYITNNGTTNNYNINTDQTSHFYRDITVPAGESKITLSFYIKGIGEAGYDRLLIYTAPITVTPTAGTPAQWSTNFPGATLVYTQTNTISNYALVTFDLDPSFAGTSFRLIFTWQNDNNTGSPPPVSVDNIKITSCAEVQAGFTTPNTYIIPGTTITFTDNSTGSPTSWSWTFAGGTPATSTLQNPVITYNTTGTFDVSLTTTNNCSSSDSETKTNYITVQDYCPSSGNMDYLDCVTLVNFNTINNSTGVKTVGYSDYTSQSTNIVIGYSYDLTVNINTDGNYTNTAIVWIDWNHNGDFTDAGEEYDLGTANNVSDGASSNSPLSVIVPNGAVIGNTRMRVSTRYNSYPTSCQTNFDGEVEDYTVNICKNPNVPTVSFSANPICSGDDVTLLISGNLNSASQWVIYTESCGGTQVGTTTTSSFTLNNVSSTTTYYVRGEGSCITAGSCGIATITVNPLPTAIITGSATICTGGSTDLTVTFTGTGPWDFDYTANGVAQPTVQNITNNPETFTLTPTTTTIYEIVSVTDANCSNTVSSSATITVDPTSVGGTAATDQTICSGETPANITLTGQTGAIQWQVSSDNSSFSDISGATATPLTGAQMGTLAATTYYRAAVTSGTCAVDYSNTVTIDIYSTTITSGTVGGASVVEMCSGGNPPTFHVGAPSGGDGNYTYQWEESTDCTGTWINATAQDGNTTSLSFNPPALTNTICYRLKITDGCGSTGYSTTKTYNIVPDPVSQTINPTPADGSTICIGDDVSATFSGGSGGTGTVADVYEFSTDGASNWSSYTPGNNITATAGMVGADMIQIRTRRTATGSGCNNGSWNYTKWTVAADNTIALTSATGTDNQSVCLNTAITNITYSTTGATGATFSGLPPGVTGNWAADVVTISGASTTFGTFNYTVTLTGGCGTTTANGTITVEDTEDPTITCPANVTVNPDAGLCTASGVALGTPTTSDNCNVASVSNNANEPYAIGNTTVTWTVTDDAGNSATCNQTVTVQPTAIIDIEVVDLGNSCQSGETGSTTTITWDINLLHGSNNWSYDYTINDGTTDVQTGTNVNATGNIQISYTMSNETATNKTYTITLTNVKDNCGVAETNTGNNSDTATLYGVPNTGDIIPD